MSGYCSDRGRVIRSWGGPGYVPDWPSNEHALAIDRAGNVRISGNGADDRGALKFSADGRQLLESGAFRRGWGAYGSALADIPNTVEQPEKDIATAGLRPAYAPGGTPEPQFRSPVHCVRLSADGLVYVCDRHNDRIQVFTKTGRFLREFSVRPATLGNGSTWTVTFSRDRAQKYLLVGDGENNVVWVLDRASGEVVSGFGHFGSGERLQKFTLRPR